MSGKLIFLKVLLILHYTTFTGHIMLTMIPTVASSTAIRSSPTNVEYNLSPLRSSPSLLSLPDYFGGSGRGGRFAGDANVNNNNPLESVLETLMEGGASVLLVTPPRDNIIEKRDPPDVGAGRGHTGNQVVNTLRAQSASYDPVGPGRKKRWRMKRNVAPGTAEPEGDDGEDEQY